MELERRLSRRESVRLFIAAFAVTAVNSGHERFGPSRLAFAQTPNPENPDVISNSNPEQKPQENPLTTLSIPAALVVVGAAVGGIVHIFLMANQKYERRRENIDK